MIYSRRPLNEIEHDPLIRVINSQCGSRPPIALAIDRPISGTELVTLSTDKANFLFIDRFIIDALMIALILSMIRLHYGGDNAPQYRHRTS
jgi:hypothetical protein